MPKTYLDFDLLIERTAPGYRARVLDSPSGQAALDFTLPFSSQDVEIFLLRLSRSLSEARRRVRRLESNERELVKRFGGQLFESVFAGPLLGALQSSLNEAFRTDAGLRIRLRLTNAPELADLPWEFMFNPAENRFVSLGPDAPLVRYLEVPMPARPLTVAPPLNILVMISSPVELQQLDVEGEWERLNAALRSVADQGLVTITRVAGASLASLQRPLRTGTYHVFHFVGHGGFDERAQDGALALEDSQGRMRLVSGQDLGVMLGSHRSLRLIVLNSCEGARAAASDPFAGVAQSLVQQGMPAVIAMQFEITDEAAITFGEELYSAIADGYPIDAALGESRRAIFASGNDVEWATPVLYTRAPDGQLFDVIASFEQTNRGVRRPAPSDESLAVAAHDSGTGGPVDQPPATTSTDRGGMPRVLRRLVAPVAIIVVTVVLVIANQPNSGSGEIDSPNPSASEGEITATSPWRLVVRDAIEGEDNGCAIVLTDIETDEQVLAESDIYGLEGDSFQVRKSGTFEWQVNDPGCVVFQRAGGGDRNLPFPWMGGRGDTDVFEAPDQLVLEVRPDPTGSEDWSCDLTVRDAETGDVVEFGTATAAENPLVLATSAFSKVYIENPDCDVEVSAG